MKAFKVFWKDRIIPTGDFVAQGIVIAGNVSEALKVALTYGEVISVTTEAALIWRPSDVEAEKAVILADKIVAWANGVDLGRPEESTRG